MFCSANDHHTLRFFFTQTKQKKTFFDEASETTWKWCLIGNKKTKVMKMIKDYIQFVCR